MADAEDESATKSPPTRRHITKNLAIVQGQSHFAMGKIAGISGTIRGKIGMNVYSKGEKGVSYARQYQPQVYNPKTIAQTDQRAKMNLVGRMSQVTPKDLLSGLKGDNNRQRRSNFNAHLLDIATIDRSAPNSVVAKVKPIDIIFSEGGEAIYATANNMKVNSSSASIELTITDETMLGRYGERIVVAVIDPNDKGGYSLVRYKDVVIDKPSANIYSVPFGTTILNESLVCIYRAPFVLTDEGMTFRSQSLANDGVDITAQLLGSNSTAVRGWGNSVLMGSQVFTQA